MDDSRWSSRPDPTDRLWDLGPLEYATAPSLGRAHCAVLTSGEGLQLYVTQRPQRKDQFIVAPLLPAGTRRHHTEGIATPRGIAVPSDPARASSQVRRRLLFSFRIACMQAQQKASPGPLQRPSVEFALDTEGRWNVSTVYPRALALLLAHGFRLDAGTGRCHAPHDLADGQTVHIVEQAALRLDALGFSVFLRAPGAARMPASALVPPSNSRATPPPNSAVRPRRLSV